MTLDLDGDAEGRYQDARERRQTILDRWGELDRPLTAAGSKGQLAPHPLVTMLREHDLLCGQLAVPLRKRHRGPEPSAVPSRQESRTLVRREGRSRI